MRKREEYLPNKNCNSKSCKNPISHHETGFLLCIALIRQGYLDGRLRKFAVSVFPWFVQRFALG